MLKRSGSKRSHLLVRLRDAAARIAIVVRLATYRTIFDRVRIVHHVATIREYAVRVQYAGWIKLARRDVVVATVTTVTIEAAHCVIRDVTVTNPIAVICRVVRAVPTICTRGKPTFYTILRDMRTEWFVYIFIRVRLTKVFVRGSLFVF